MTLPQELQNLCRLDADAINALKESLAISFQKLNVAVGQLNSYLAAQAASFNSQFTLSSIKGSASLSIGNFLAGCGPLTRTLLECLLPLLNDIKWGTPGLESRLNAPCFPPIPQASISAQFTCFAKGIEQLEDQGESIVIPPSPIPDTPFEVENLTYSRTDVDTPGSTVGPDVLLSWDDTRNTETVLYQIDVHGTQYGLTTDTEFIIEGLTPGREIPVSVTTYDASRIRFSDPVDIIVIPFDFRDLTDIAPFYLLGFNGEDAWFAWTKTEHENVIGYNLRWTGDDGRMNVYHAGDRSRALVRNALPVGRPVDVTLTFLTPFDESPGLTITVELVDFAAAAIQFTPPVPPVPPPATVMNYLLTTNMTLAPDGDWHKAWLVNTDPAETIQIAPANINVVGPSQLSVGWTQPPPGVSGGPYTILRVRTYSSLGDELEREESMA